MPSPMNRSSAPTLVGAAVLLGGCGNAPAPPAVVDVAPLAAAPAAPTPQPATRSIATPEHPGARSPLARLIDVEMPRAWSCVHGATDVRFDAELSLSHGDRPFAAIGARGPLVARLAEGGGWFMVDVETEGVFFRGVASARSVPLYAQRPLVFADFVAPQPGAPVDVYSVTEDGTLILSLGWQANLGWEPRRASPCADVGLTTQSFDARSAFPPSTRRGELVGETIQLALRAEGDGWATLEPDESASRSIDILDVRGDRVRIAWSTGPLVASGWVPLANVTLDVDVGDAFGAGGLGLSGTGEGSAPPVRVCPVDVSLGVEIDDVQRTVGYVRRGVPMLESRGGRGAFVAIQFVGTEIQLAEGARFLVDADTLASCPLR